MMNINDESHTVRYSTGIRTYGTGILVVRYLSGIELSSRLDYCNDFVPLSILRYIGSLVVATIFFGPLILIDTAQGISVWRVTECNGTDGYHACVRALQNVSQGEILVF